MDIEERVARLERLIGMETEVIKAKEFQVIGNNGQLLAMMGTNSEGNGLVVTGNAEGKTIAGLGADDNGSVRTTCQRRF